MSTVYEESIAIHERLRGKIKVVGKVPIKTAEDLSLAYTPGVAGPCRAIYGRPELARELTVKNNSVAVVTDGSAVLGLGDIGPLASLPVMEGKALLFRQYAGVDAWPICLDCRDVDAIVDTVRRMAPSFGGVNLEDISSPRCFEIEERLQDIGIPVFHDDQHGTAIVVLAALMNAARLVERDMGSFRVVINGAGAAGIAIARLLANVEGEKSLVEEVVVCDSKGAIHADRLDLNDFKKSLLEFTNAKGRRGTVQEVLRGTDVFVGVSVGNLLVPTDISSMAKDPIIFALANPYPEILPEAAYEGGAAIVGTGRSDFPNQINNVLAFPGIFRGALDARSKVICSKMKQAAAHALVRATGDPSPDAILPSVLDKHVAYMVGEAVCEAALLSQDI